jgi:hypothetical protein
LARFTLPSFMSTKRGRVITAGTAGTLILATAISTAGVALSSSAAAVGTADAYMTSVSANSAAMQAAHPAGDSTSHQQAAMLSKSGAIKAEHEQQVFAEKAAVAKAKADKAAAKAAAAKAAAKVRAAKAATPSGSPQQIAQQMLGQYGWSGSQMSCLTPLWGHESNWNVNAENASSGAYGIPQALPGSQMAAAGSDWRTNAATQIKWGLTYIHDRYGSPCGAEAHELSSNWY